MSLPVIWFALSFVWVVCTIKGPVWLMTIGPFLGWLGIAIVAAVLGHWEPLVGGSIVIAVGVVAVLADRLVEWRAKS
jgi:hypothetical protein